MGQGLRKSLGEFGPGAGERDASGADSDEDDEVSHAGEDCDDCDAAGVTAAWKQERGLSLLERWQRKKAARRIERALRHAGRFASEEEEMAWLLREAASAGRLAQFEEWLESAGLDAPSKVWAAETPSGWSFLLRAGPHVNLAKLNLLSSLPEDVSVGGSLTLAGCSGLEALPASLRVAGAVDLSGCSGLRSLPRGLEVVGASLDARDCSGLTSLPEGLSVKGNLRLRSCTALASLPEGLRVEDGYLDVSRCTALTSLPTGLCLSGYLDASRTALESLPGDLNVNGNLLLRRCAQLRWLPDSLKVGGSLELWRCPALEALPRALCVGKDLVLRRCTGLETIPDDVVVGGDLNLEGCTGIVALPECVRRWPMRSDGEPHNIYLTGSGLPHEELARLQALDNPALRFHVSRAEAFGGADLAVDDFASLDEAAAFWVAQAEPEKNTEKARVALDLDVGPAVEAAYVRGVVAFLSQLRRAKEFNNSRTKVGLASRVVQVLELVAGDDAGVREELLIRMADAVDTCSDKPMWALNQMEVVLHICQARGDRAKLRALGMGVMRLEVVHQHVRKAMAAMHFVDDVCVYLRFEIALRDALDLPVSALEMAYPTYVTVSEESIAAAEEEALALTEANLEEWLPSWTEWQRQDRLEYSTKLAFSSLRRNSTRVRLSLSLRSLTGAKINDPVRVRPSSAIWSLEDLLKHWVSTGMDLNNTPRDVDYMRLNLTKLL